MLINILCSNVSFLKSKAIDLQENTHRKQEDLWRALLFAAFLSGTLMDGLLDPNLSAFFVEDGKAIVLLLLPSVLSWLASAALYGNYLILLFSFSFGTILSFCSHLVWAEELWIGQQKRFVLCASFCLPAFFLVSMFAVRTSLILQSAVHRESGSRKRELTSNLLKGFGIVTGLFCSIWLLCNAIIP